MSLLSVDFLHYHNANPQVFAAYTRAARMVPRGKKVGAKLLAERLRWESIIDLKSTGEFKIQNSFVSLYARLLMWRFPEFRGMFNLKHIAIDGPKDAVNLENVRTWNQTYWNGFNK